MSAFRLKLGPMYWDAYASSFRKSDKDAQNWAGISGKELCRESLAALVKCNNLHGWRLELERNGEQTITKK